MRDRPVRQRRGVVAEGDALEESRETHSSPRNEFLAQAGDFDGDGDESWFGLHGFPGDEPPRMRLDEVAGDGERDEARAELDQHEMDVNGGVGQPATQEQGSPARVKQEKQWRGLLGLAPSEPRLA